MSVNWRPMAAEIRAKQLPINQTGPKAPRLNLADTDPACRRKELKVAPGKIDIKQSADAAKKIGRRSARSNARETPSVL